METFIEISPQKAWEMMENDGAILADVRDIRRHIYSHPKDAFHLTNESYGRFQDEADYEDPVIIICYHGISSRHTAQFLVEQGYDNVYSVKGGFEAWERAGLPIETSY